MTRLRAFAENRTVQTVIWALNVALFVLETVPWLACVWALMIVWDCLSLARAYQA